VIRPDSNTPYRAARPLLAALLAPAFRDCSQVALGEHVFRGPTDLACRTLVEHEPLIPLAPRLRIGHVPVAERLASAAPVAVLRALRLGALDALADILSLPGVGRCQDARDPATGSRVQVERRRLDVGVLGTELLG
jgi:hypothetical protein